jgi:hypothetical protein
VSGLGKHVIEGGVIEIGLINELYEQRHLYRNSVHVVELSCHAFSEYDTNLVFSDAGGVWQVRDRAFYRPLSIACHH